MLGLNIASHFLVSENHLFYLKSVESKQVEDDVPLQIRYFLLSNILTINITILAFESDLSL
jgi:hypothetical protein